MICLASQPVRFTSFFKQMRIKRHAIPTDSFGITSGIKPEGTFIYILR